MVIKGTGKQGRGRGEASRRHPARPRRRRGWHTLGGGTRAGPLPPPHTPLAPAGARRPGVPPRGGRQARPGRRRSFLPCCAACRACGRAPARCDARTACGSNTHGHSAKKGALEGCHGAMARGIRPALPPTMTAFYWQRAAPRRRSARARPRRLRRPADAVAHGMPSTGRGAQAEEGFPAGAGA